MRNFGISYSIAEDLRNIRRSNGLYVLISISAMMNATQGYMLSHFIDYYRLDSAVQGMIGSIQSLGCVIALLFAVRLNKSISKQRQLTLSAVGIIILAVLIGFLPVFPVLLVCYAVFGLMFGIQNAGTSSLIVDLHDEKRLPRYMSYLHGIFGVGGLVAPLIFMLLESSLKRWNQVFWGAALLFVMLFAAYLRLYDGFFEGKHEAASPQETPQRGKYSAFLRQKANIMLLVSALCFGGHQILISLWIKRYIFVTYKVEFLSTLALSLFWIGNAISRMLAPQIRMPGLKVILYGNLSATCVIILAVVMKSALFATISALLVGLLNGMTIPFLLTTSALWNPQDSGIAASAPLLWIHTAQFIMMLVSGVIVSLLSLGGCLSISALLAACCAFAFLTASFFKKKAYKNITDEQISAALQRDL